MPDSTPLTEMETRLRALGAQADAAAPASAPVSTPGETSADSPPAALSEEEPGAPGGPAGQAASGDERSENLSAESAAAEGSAAAPDPGLETPYDEAKRAGREREARAWQKIEEEKASLRQERARRETERAHAAPEGAAPETFHHDWWEGVRQEVRETPELRDESSPLGKAVQAVLRESRVFSLGADGFRQAAALAKSRLEAAALPALRQQIETLTHENERLVRLTSVTGTPPARRAAPEGENLSERDLRRLAAEHDSVTAA